MSDMAINVRMVFYMARQAGLDDSAATALIEALAPSVRMDGNPYYSPAAASRSIAFHCGLKRQAELEEEQAAASGAWRSIAGVGAGAMGLTPDSVKLGGEYRAARNRYESASAHLKRFNAKFCKRYAAELRAERDARRERQRAAAA